MVFSQKPGTAKIGAVLLLISFIIALIGTLSPSWYKSRNSTSGIWMFCLGPGEFENCGSINLAYQPDWYLAVLSLAAIGVILLFISTIAAFCATGRAVAAILGILGGLLVIVSVVVYYVKQNEAVSTFSELLYWGFYLSGISGGLGFIGALLLIPGQNQNAVSTY